MDLTWRERLKRQPELVDVTCWPPLDLETIPAHRRAGYRRNLKVVQRVLEGDVLTTAAQAVGLSATRVWQLLERALAGPPDVAPALRQGLVPYRVLPGNWVPSPPRGQFARLMATVPGLRDGLDQMLLERVKDRAWAEVPTPRSYYERFKVLLARAHWPLDTYPYTTNDVAYESVRRDLHARWTLLLQAQKARRKAFTRLPMVRPDAWVYDRVELDEQTIDCTQSTVGIELPFGAHLPPMRLSRLTVMAAIDTGSDCLLGYHLALTGAPNQEDVLALLQQCVTPGAPRTLLTPGLRCAAGAAFPALLDDVPLPVISEIALDNAWCHHADSIETFVCHTLKSTLSFGVPNHPTVRHAIERTFHELNRRLSHRLTATTGSSVTDPKRESPRNRKGVPVVSLPVFEEMLYVVLAGENVRPRARLGTSAPLDVIRHQSERHYLATVAVTEQARWDAFAGCQEVTVHARDHQKRKPYVTFEYLQYKGAGLLAVPPDEPKILLKFDRRDIREVEAIRKNGVSLGRLTCPPHWQSLAHSVEMRRHLFRTQRALVRQSLDPLSDYLHGKRDKLTSPQAVTEFLRTYQEFVAGFGLAPSLWPVQSETATHSSEPNKPYPKKDRHNAPARSQARRFWSLTLNPGEPHNAQK